MLRWLAKANAADTLDASPESARAGVQVSAVLQEAGEAALAPQGSAAWLQARCGCATASEFSSILAKGQGKMRAAYLRKVVCERLTGKPIEAKAFGQWQKDLDRGHEQEALARMSYEVISGNLVEEVGFIKHPTIAYLGCSPDGTTGRGLVEIKSVIPTVQFETVMAGGYPSEHRAQIMGELWVTGRAWCDFVSFSPDMPGRLRTYIFRVERDETYIQELAASVKVFLREVDDLEQRLRGMA